MENELRIGVVGYCPPTKFDEDEALRMLREAYDKLDAQHKDKSKTVVSGLTNVGVLKLAYEEAKNRGWKTAGVACKQVYGFRDKWFPVDEQPIIVGQNWGDESPMFLESIDVLVRVGCEDQSMKEADEMKARGNQVIEYDLPSINEE